MVDDDGLEAAFINDAVRYLVKQLRAVALRGMQLHGLLLSLRVDVADGWNDWILMIRRSDTFGR